jgi:CDP-diacylglycerol--glycerol-3-phosphate 3-phosphatidyltransferase
VVAGSVGLVARGHLFLGALVVALSVLTDMLDGAIARARGRTSRWGAFLDSTMDRIADGAAFGSLTFWLATTGRDGAAALAMFCLIAGVIVSYAKARAEGLGLTANVGIAERSERLIVAGIGAMGEVAGIPYALEVALAILAVLAVITIGQRVHAVWKQTRELDAAVPAVADPDPAGPASQADDVAPVRPPSTDGAGRG